MTPKRRHESADLAEELARPVAPDDMADAAVDRETHGPDLPNIPILDDALAHEVAHGGQDVGEDVVGYFGGGGHASQDDPNH